MSELGGPKTPLGLDSDRARGERPEVGRGGARIASVSHPGPDRQKEPRAVRDEPSPRTGLTAEERSARWGAVLDEVLSPNRRQRRQRAQQVERAVRRKQKAARRSS